MSDQPRSPSQDAPGASASEETRLDGDAVGAGDGAAGAGADDGGAGAADGVGDAGAGDDGEYEPDMDDVRYSRRRRRARQLAAEDPTPRIPRGRFFRFAFADLMRIGMLAALLVAVFVLRKPCGESAATFIETFEAPPDAAPAADPLEGYEIVPAEELLQRLRDGGPVDLEAETAPATVPDADGETPADGALAPD